MSVYTHRCTIARLLAVIACIAGGLRAQPSNPPGDAATPNSTSAPEAVRVGFLLGPGSEPFTSMANGEPGGFEVELMKQLCSTSNLNCVFSPLNTLEDRIQAVVNNSIDVSIGHLAFTPGRSAAVDYVKPCYYLAGTALYTRDGAESDTPGTAFTRPPELPKTTPTVSWDSLSGRNVCFLKGYYATPFIVERYHVKIVTVESVEEGVSKTQSSECTGFAFPDSADPKTLSGLKKNSNIDVVYASPYCIAVARGNSALRNQLTVALVAAHADGDNSTILQLEQKELVAKGLEPNRGIRQAVNVITEYDALYTPQGDEIPPSYALFGAG